MALSPTDLQTLLNLVRSDPEARRQFQAILEMDALLELPGAVDRIDHRLDRLAEVVTDLGAAQRRTEERVNELVEAQRRTEERVNELAEAQRRTEERVNELAEAQRRTEERVNELAEAQRRTEERVNELAEAQRRTEERVNELAEAQRRTEERLERLESVVIDLAEAQKRTEERLERLEAVVSSLADSVEKLIEEVSGLSRWQRGEAGRREGEQYERRIQRNAVLLLNGGQGGGPEQSVVQTRLSEMFQRLPSGDLLPDDESPSLADIVWWKGDTYAVVEVSVKVDTNDIVRAARRAETLRRIGVSVIPIVIGEDWASEDTEERALARSVEWKVGSNLSKGLIAYRRLAP